MTKTKDVLIEVARRLFAEKGKERTTMNDIALESKKGRRTIYTYFNTKEDIFLSVIERELRDLLDALIFIEKKDISADEKLKEYIFVRLDKFKEIIERNGTLKASFFKDAIAVEKARRNLDVKEIQLLKRIFENGIKENVFALKDPQWAAELTLHLLRGIEKPYYRDKFYKKLHERKDIFIDAFFYGILKK